jgi:hypothetical protein
MATTSQVVASENKKIIQDFSYEDFAIVYGELNILEESLRNLWKIATTTDDERLQVDTYKWLIEMGVGKAAQKVDMTSKGEKISAGIFIEDFDDDKEIQTS